MSNWLAKRRLCHFRPHQVYLIKSWKKGFLSLWSLNLLSYKWKMTKKIEFIAVLKQHFRNFNGPCCHTRKMWFHLCSYSVWVINRYNLLMGWVYVQWPYVFCRNLLTEVLFEPMSFLYSSNTWQHTLIWPDSLAVANVCKLSLGVFLYQAPVLSTSLEGDFSISLPSISFSV